MGSLPCVLTTEQAAKLTYYVVFLMLIVFLARMTMKYTVHGMHYFVEIFYIILYMIHMVLFLFLQFILTYLITLVYNLLKVILTGIYLFPFYYKNHKIIEITLCLVDIIENTEGYNLWNLIHAVVKLIAYSLIALLKLFISLIGSIFKFLFGW